MPALTVLTVVVLSLAALPPPVTAAPHRLRLSSALARGHSPATADAPTTFFEVDRPAFSFAVPNCSALLLSHSFAYTYGQPPVVTPYHPPPCLAEHGLSSLSGAVLEWSAASAGRQFDRIFGVWLAGAELLRSCTAEPRPNGIFWTVRKDISRHAALLAGDGDLAVFLGNIVDSTYTGIYHVNVTLHLYFSGKQAADRADLILPISRPLPLNDGLWFEIRGAGEKTTVAVPKNAYRAVLEVFVSFHQDDESWYTNPPNDYIEANNLTGVPGNGPFREITVSIDGEIVGAVWPFTVIYTGGINPLLWSPITGIGSFDLPTYDIEITPFLGKLLDGSPHEFGFAVTNALDVWYVDANLHLWLDSKSSATAGGVIEHAAPPLVMSANSQFTGLDGKFTTTARRDISAAGWVRTSHGTITTRFTQNFEFDNVNVFSGNGSIQVVNQITQSLSRAVGKSAAAVLLSAEVHYKFPLRLYTAMMDVVGDSYTLVSNVSLELDKTTIAGGESGFAFSSLTNAQNGSGEMQVANNLVIAGVAGTTEAYRYEGNDGCYWRDLGSRNYTVLYDLAGESCADKNSLANGRKSSVASSGGFLAAGGRAISASSASPSLATGRS